MTSALKKAMLLAAGKGERMRHLTTDTPKPLLKVQGKSLLEHQLQKLQAAGFEQVVINLGHLGTQIREAAGQMPLAGLEILFSEEGEEPLETAGGIIQALPMLSGGPFLVLNCDVWCDFPLNSLPADPDGLAHLVMVTNPQHNPDGDFALDAGRVHIADIHRYTYSGIGVYRPELFDECEEGRRALAPLLRHAASMGLLSGEHYAGLWRDIGTPERLVELETFLSQ